MLARGASLEKACDRICEHAEGLAAGGICSIVTVDRDGLLHPLAGPTISTTYSNALDGIAIGPNVGSCGTAAHFRRPVAVTDIFADPLWKPYGSLADILAKEHGVKACWSSPILRSDGRVLGAFGFYYKDNRGPTPEERMIVAECLDLCSLVLEREEVKADNQRLAFFDNLTGFGNRANFLKALEASLDGATTPLSVLLIDIDHLGRVNDAFGHATGDRVILEVGQTVARIAAPAATFRVDADEFAVLIENHAAMDLSSISTEILQAMENWARRWDKHSLPVSVTCGGAIFEPSGPRDVPTFLQHANLALHHAKQTGRGGFALYSDDLAGAIANRFRALQTVTGALAEDRVEAHYQPIVSLPTQEIVGFEALCRIRMDDGQILSAGAFADALQDLSMGHLLTDRMLERVARDIRHWLDLGLSFQYVSVNVSMADFNQGNLCERIKSVFARHRTPLKYVVLEVTETVYMDERDGRVAKAIEELRKEGLLVALDDFGTGYASLTHLLNFPVDIIKIDKTFIDRMSDGPGAVIVKALLDMSAGLGTRIVAEGVETQDQAERLRRLGCPYVQGYLFGRPVDRDRTTQVLRPEASSSRHKAKRKLKQSATLMR
ncbi:diguanylate cyclase (GGDEF)-like protein [Rhizobium sp. BK650]|uniref:bifunctional diguanylate cyclase/phosphodiesterase n=1 Tax=Rhizobium sp. BK650 TaxID=2586990 RepID=UPI0016074812|nr:GGDEF domain-containing protein [Rhizobium sp. BK650]MBB3657702.1 diguanylate cyclase (GGDEF)-like protein [Rhizobium sp. BK650]